MADETYTIERSLRMDASPERVYQQVADFRRWTSWSPWEDIDPAMQRAFSGSESGAGAVYSWSGNRRAGQGRMQITEAMHPSRVVIDLVFEKPWKARNETSFLIEPDGSGSRVTWSMTGKKTVMTKVMGVFRSMDAMLGPDFERGLARLKSAAESPSTT
jgi:uncharacterized protein YndB with AHSA1/START domain